MSGHQYWSQSKQYQQRNHQQQQGQSRQRRVVRDDFGDEWIGKEVESKVTEGANVVVLRGRVIDVAKYWLKIAIDGGVIYVNKAAVVSIKPLQ